MKYTRQEIIDKINKNDARFFQNIYYDWKGSSTGVEKEELWELNWGDGNDWFVAMRLPEYDVNVFLSGWYSSHGDSEFDSVSFGVEYEFKETRWRGANKAEIREMNIDKVISEESDSV